MRGSALRGAGHGDQHPICERPAAMGWAGADTSDNDPCGERDFGAFEHNGQRTTATAR
jgi:hypothetical protein